MLHIFHTMPIFVEWVLWIKVIIIVKELHHIDFNWIQMRIIYSLKICILLIIILRNGKIFFPSFVPKSARLIFVLKSHPSRYLSEKEPETFFHKQKTRIRREILNHLHLLKMSFNLPTFGDRNKSKFSEWTWEYSGFIFGLNIAIPMPLSMFLDVQFYL